MIFSIGGAHGATRFEAAPKQAMDLSDCTARDARFFDLLLLWGRTRLPAMIGTLRFWKASSYSPLTLDLPDAQGRRSSAVIAVAGVCRWTPSC